MDKYIQISSNPKIAQQIKDLMDFLHENAKVGSLVAKTPEYANLFEELGLDYCCKGNKTLKELCEEKKLSVTEVLHKLKQMTGSTKTIDWDQMSLQEIIAHIVDTYHSHSRKELERIDSLLDKVVAKHGDRYAYIAHLQNVFKKLKNSLLEHMEEEERIAFPAIVNFSISGICNPKQMKDALHSLDADHSETGLDLERIKGLTQGYTPPADACATHIVLIHSLAQLEKEMHEHIHKENHILFPRVMAEISFKKMSG